MAIYFLPLFVVDLCFRLKQNTRFFLKSDLESSLMVFLAGKHSSIVYGFPSGFLHCSKYRGFSEFCGSWNSGMLKVKDLVSGVVGGFKNWQCIADC